MDASAVVRRALQRLDVPAAVSLALLVQTLISMLAASVPVLAPEIAASHGWNVDLIVFFPAIVYVSAFLISFQVPAFLVRFGGMGVSILCVLVSAVGLLCFAIPSLGLAAAAAFAFGIANGAMNPASAQVLGPRTSPRTAGLIMSIKQTGVPLGAMAAGALPPLLVLYVGWQMAIVELAVACMVIALLLIPAVRWLNGPASARAARSYRPLEPLKRLLGLKGMQALLLAGMAFAAMQLCLRSFFTVYLVSGLGLGLATAGLTFSASQAAGIVGQIAWATLSDRLFTAHAVMAILGVLMAIAAGLTAAFTPDWPATAVVAVAALFGFSAGGFIPVVLGEIARRASPSEAGPLTSAAQLFLIAGAIVGPLLFGGIASIAGYPGAFLAVAAWTVCGSLLLCSSGPVGFLDRPR